MKFICKICRNLYSPICWCRWANWQEAAGRATGPRYLRQGPSTVRGRRLSLPGHAGLRAAAAAAGRRRPQPSTRDTFPAAAAAARDASRAGCQGRPACGSVLPLGAPWMGGDSRGCGAVMRLRGAGGCGSGVAAGYAAAARTDRPELRPPGLAMEQRGRPAPRAPSHSRLAVIASHSRTGAAPVAGRLGTRPVGHVPSGLA